MAKHKKILVAFDGSETGLKALNTAKELTKDNDAYLVVVYVHEFSIEYPINVGTTQKGEEFLFQPTLAAGQVGTSRHIVGQEKIDVNEEMPDHVMSIAKSQLADLQGVAYVKLVGKPAKKIVSYATTNDMDLIVIGHRGIGAIQKLVMGSVSLKVTNNSKCSVFVVK